MVSIITITHNRAHLLGETIRTVLSQSYTDFEYIIIDDASTDNTSQIIENFKDPRIKYFKLENKTDRLSKIRNYGLERVAREYIAFIDSDDLWGKDNLQVQMKIIQENPQIGFCFCDVQVFTKEKILAENIYEANGREYKIENMFDKFIRGNLPIYSSSNMIFRRECLKVIGKMDENMEAGEHDFVSRLLFHYVGCIIYQSLVRIRRHENNHSFLTIPLSYREYIFSLKKLLMSNSINKKRYNKVAGFCHYKIGYFHFENKQFKMAKEEFLQSYFLNPLNYKSILMYLKTYFSKQ